MHIIEKRCEDDRQVTCCPQVRRSLNGETIIPVTGQWNQSHFIRLLSWVPGNQKPFPAHRATVFEDEKCRRHGGYRPVQRAQDRICRRSI